MSKGRKYSMIDITFLSVGAVLLLVEGVFLDFRHLLRVIHVLLALFEVLVKPLEDLEVIPLFTK